MSSQVDIEVINTKTDELLSKELNEELFIEIYSGKNLSNTKIENTNQLVKLFKNETTQYKLSNQVGRIIFDDFIFVDTIGFKPEKQGKFELNYTTITNVSKKITAEKVNDKGRIVFLIKDAISSFNIIYDKTILFSSKQKSITISNLWIFGLNIQDFNKELDYLKNLYDDRDNFLSEFNELKLKIDQGKNELNQKKNETDQYISEKENSIEELEEKIEDLETTKDDLKSVIQNLDTKKENLESQISAKNTELDRLNTNNENLKKVNQNIENEISKLKERKEDLSTEVNLVPDNLIGFNQRTSESKKTYYWLCTIPLVMLSILFYCAWSNITKLSTAENVKTLEQAYVLLIQRLPLTFLIITLVSILVALLYKMLRHLMEIQQQELSLSKISVLARDVADSEYQHLPENEKQEHRIRHKMQLIREYFNSEFERHKEFIKNEKNEDIGQGINIPAQLRNLAKSKK
ncbi:hypothetical protein [Acinetobacter pseudolwoffii]|uniref:hypothetical protein n=1 Tax=Acinetobacter pseudolwoffii TaxID=2053287 RepID=UPI000C244BFA|nr:hypothetical protein [Acinetobacter pseudolwoffii]PJI35885.1 hypothetical protein CU318_06265 [Acinetobacter pseudolwoffii]